MRRRVLNTVAFYLCVAATLSGCSLDSDSDHAEVTWHAVAPPIDRQVTITAALDGTLYAVYMGSYPYDDSRYRMYVSSDRGSEWRMVNLGFECYRIEVVDVDVILARSDSGVRISKDQGATWRNTSVGSGFGWTSRPFYSIIPGVQIAFLDQTRDALYWSTSQAGIWHKVNLPQSMYAPASMAAIIPSAFLVSSDRLYHTDNRGSGWTDVGDAVEDLAVNGDGIVVSVSRRAILVSHDSGVTWTSDGLHGLGGHKVIALMDDRFAVLGSNLSVITLDKTGRLLKRHRPSFRLARGHGHLPEFPHVRLMSDAAGYLYVSAIPPTEKRGRATIVSQEPI